MSEKKKPRFLTHQEAEEENMRHWLSLSVDDRMAALYQKQVQLLGPAWEKATLNTASLTIVRQGHEIKQNPPA